MSRKFFFEIPPYCAQIQLLFHLRYFFLSLFHLLRGCCLEKHTHTHTQNYILAKIMKECDLKVFRTCWLRETMNEDLRITLSYLYRMATKPCHIGFWDCFLPAPLFRVSLTLHAHYPLLCNTERKYTDNSSNAQMLWSFKGGKPTPALKVPC